MIYLVLFSVPLTILVILLAKTVDKWLPVFRSWPQWQKVVFITATGMIVAYGGSKGTPPTKTNLRLLLAERVRLSNNMPYGKKSKIVTAEQATRDAAFNVSSATADLIVASNALDVAGVAIATAKSAPRKYVRLHTQPPEIPPGTLYGEIADARVIAGVAEVAVWFNVVPASTPEMRFSFASRSATSRWHSAPAEQSSWPTTFTVLDRECYYFYFPCPARLLTPAGALIAPLSFAQEISWGAPDTQEPLDLRGGLVFEVDGQYWEAVTGYRTNELGEVFYFENGCLVIPDNRRD
jgi:hypothetical protein